MGRLSLIIADNDIEYLANFEKFLLVNYPQRFELFSFSSTDLLNDFLAHTQSIDILIISSRIYRNGMHLSTAELVLLLSEDGPVYAQKAGRRAAASLEGLESVHKYQHMDKLVAEIIRIYSEKSLKNCSISRHGNTSIISVYSPSGGAGSSSIAAGCSILCAGRGIKSFYLNMESMPSTDLFFQGDCVQTFSNVIFHLKGKCGNLQLKLEGAKCVDTKYGVHYFGPPENILELNEMTDQEVACLVSGLKSSAVYSYIFIDMSSGLNSFNTAILKLTDVILLVLDQDRRTMLKLKEFKAGLDLIEHKNGIGLADRILPILNRSNGKTEIVKHLIPFAGCRPMIGISDCSRSDTAAPIENKEFLTGLNSILENLPFRSTAEGINCYGGEHIA